MIHRNIVAIPTTVSLLLLVGCQSNTAQSTPAKPVANSTAVASSSASESTSASAKESDVSSSDAGSEVAMFAAGCFWGVEQKFRQVEGVQATEVGYAGGDHAGVTYKEVCTDRTGHAEVVRVTFDPSQVSYRELIDVFFDSHDPTQVNRQGPDVGKQYRSAIFYTTPEQQQIAEKALEDVQESGKFSRPVATEIAPVVNYTKAEEYHQQYLAKKGLDSCSTTIGH